jgi:DnaJ-class molecular chaperone
MIAINCKLDLRACINVLESIYNGFDYISCENIGKAGGEVSLLTHQKVIRDYINIYTPYRGVLLYHGLGSGKTLSSIAIAEGMKDNKRIIVMTPASLRRNYMEELKKCGDLIFIIKDKNNSYYKRIENDLIYYKEITLGDSIIGTQINIEYITGENISYFENNIIKYNSYSVISNKGMPIKDKQGQFGNLYVVYKIIYPNKTLSDNEKMILKRILPISDTNIFNDSNNCITQLNDNFSIEDIQEKYNNIKSNNRNHNYNNIHSIFSNFF